MNEITSCQGQLLSKFTVYSTYSTFRKNKSIQIHLTPSNRMSNISDNHFLAMEPAPLTVQVPATRSCHHPKGSPFLWMASANWWLASLHGKTDVTPPNFRSPKINLCGYTHDYSEGTCLNMICIHQEICAVLFIQTCTLTTGHDHTFNF